MGPRGVSSRDPIHCTDPNAVDACGGEVNLGDGIGPGPAQTVRQQVGRAHLIHELRINNPTVVVLETLCLDQHKPPARRFFGGG